MGVAVVGIEELCGSRTADAVMAYHDEVGVPVEVWGPRGKLAQRAEHCARNMGYRILVCLTDIDEHYRMIAIAYKLGDFLD